MFIGLCRLAPSQPNNVVITPIQTPSIRFIESYLALKKQHRMCPEHIFDHVEDPVGPVPLVSVVSTQSHLHCAGS